MVLFLTWGVPSNRDDERPYIYPHRHIRLDSYLPPFSEKLYNVFCVASSTQHADCLVNESCLILSNDGLVVLVLKRCAELIEVMNLNHSRAVILQHRIPGTFLRTNRFGITIQRWRRVNLATKLYK